MSAIIIPFPTRHRPRQPQRVFFEVVRVLPGEDGEFWTIHGSFGWLHSSWRDALEDAFDVATEIGAGAAIKLDHQGGFND